MPGEKQPTATNRLISLMSEHDRRWVEDNSTRISMPQYHQPFGQDANLDAVYFPIDCIISMLAGGGEAERVEVAIVGNEGAAGACSLLGAETAVCDYVVQVPGEVLRLDIASFNARSRDSESFDGLMKRYVLAMMRQIMQVSVCRQLHTVEERCARWLLMIHDGAGSDTFSLTQEFVAELLGVRRATVNLSIGILKTAGFIRYSRGTITILDRPGLESAACPCYEITRRAYEAAVTQIKNPD